jgi:hypothetical protein
MAVKQADLAKLGIETESGFLGTPSGSVFRLPGAVLLEWQTEFAKRFSRVSVWRQETEQNFVGKWFSGTIEFELHPCRAFASILNSFFRIIGIIPDAGYNTATYRPWRNDPPGTSSVRIKTEFDGHWMEFSGVVFHRIRITSRSRSIVRVSAEWKAARLTEYTSDPSWTFLEDPSLLMTADVCSATIDSVAHDQLLEFSVEFQDGRELTNMGQAGEFSQATRDGLQTISGTLVEYFDPSLDLPGEARSGTSVDLDLVIQSQADATKFLKIYLPAVVFQKADPVAMEPGDSMNNATFRAHQPSALNDLDELRIQYVFPT